MKAAEQGLVGFSSTCWNAQGMPEVAQGHPVSLRHRRRRTTSAPWRASPRCSRMIFAFARDGGFPFISPWLRKISPKYRTPGWRSWVGALACFILGMFAGFDAARLHHPRRRAAPCSFTCPTPCRLAPASLRRARAGTRRARSISASGLSRSRRLPVLGGIGPRVCSASSRPISWSGSSWPSRSSCLWSSGSPSSGQTLPRPAADR